MNSREQPYTGDVDPLELIGTPQPPPFALLHRPQRAPDAVDVIIGYLTAPASTAEIALPRGPAGGPFDVLAVLPYRQLTERGLPCVDDGEPLLAMTVARTARYQLTEVLSRLPDVTTRVDGEHFDVTDHAYADMVGRITTTELAGTESHYYLIRRTMVAGIADYTLRNALSIYRRLLANTAGGYWTFLVHACGRVLVGATPERHVTLADGVATMNPIRGADHLPGTGDAFDDAARFLADRREADDLRLIVDEEVKLLSQVCRNGGCVVRPYLKNHMEYAIEGRTTSDPREILRATMFAPTVTGNALDRASRVIARHEPTGRGYYGGVAALMGRDARGKPTLDSAVLIRTADIDRRGGLRIGVGTPLAWHSDPHAAVARSRAKATGLLTAFGIDGPSRSTDRPTVRSALQRRNEEIARFWLADDAAATSPLPQLVGREVLVVDADDSFTSMISHRLRSLGLAVTVHRFDRPLPLDEVDLVVLGHGPGDPRQADQPRIARLSTTIATLLGARRPFLAACLSHQVLSLRLGFDLFGRGSPHQGAQCEIDLFGSAERVGFYNTLAAYSDTDERHCPGIGVVEVSRDRDTGEVHALRGPNFASMQFNAESVLTPAGARIVRARITELLDRSEPNGASGCLPQGEPNGTFGTEYAPEVPFGTPAQGQIPDTERISCAKEPAR